MLLSIRLPHIDVREGKNPSRIHTDQEQTNDSNEVQDRQNQIPRNHTWEFFQWTSYPGVFVIIWVVGS